MAAHRAACRAYHQASWKSDHMKGGTPQEEAAVDYMNATMEREGEVLEALLNCRPTTLAGVAAVLDHLSLPEFLIEGRPGTGMSTTLEGRFECKSRAAQKYPGRLAAVVRKVGGVDPPPLPVPTMSNDPIFAAIERHRKAFADFGARCSELDDLGTPEARDEWGRLHDAFDEEADNIMQGPTTIAGAVAGLRYIVENDVFEDPQEFMQSIADAIEKIAVAS
jgi:hypothetical protein